MMSSHHKGDSQAKHPDLGRHAPEIQPAIEASVAYLGSARAASSLEGDLYWPKWDSPWWHAVALWELGEARLIPSAVIRTIVEGLQSRYLQFFPARPEDVPPGKSPSREVACHCQLGTIYQLLDAVEVDVDREIPWLRPWFLKYQLPDGGLTCDEAVYRQIDAGSPSSIVGTLPPLEAILLCTHREWTPAETRFLDQGAKCLIERQLIRGATPEEREDEPDWLKLCFPRFYLYDVLRGLSWLLKWSEIRRQPLPVQAIRPVMEHLTSSFPDGQIRKGRLSSEGVGTLIRRRDLEPGRVVGPEFSAGIDARGDEWLRRQPASRFALMDALDRVGEISHSLTREWAEARARVEALGGAGLLSGA